MGIKLYYSTSGCYCVLLHSSTLDNCRYMSYLDFTVALPFSRRHCHLSFILPPLPLPPLLACSSCATCSAFEGRRQILAGLRRRRRRKKKWGGLISCALLHFVMTWARIRELKRSRGPPPPLFLPTFPIPFGRKKWVQIRCVDCLEKGGAGGGGRGGVTHNPSVHLSLYPSNHTWVLGVDMGWRGSQPILEPLEPHHLLRH